MKSSLVGPSLIAGVCDLPAQGNGGDAISLSVHLRTITLLKFDVADVARMDAGFLRPVIQG
ncbi:hypothetical protein TVD_05010 [Thioalkalivibrio versutus]|uniref:Uncharacterized protein n=1 Tax=Thioalkalivibrio versutus TaxID=106634 RepID=A0A0G3G0N2_9GAMM|nr:hypothetical protein TVD_05010 [Thioalkalivibrio versutus]